MAINRGVMKGSGATKQRSYRSRVYLPSTVFAEAAPVSNEVHSYHSLSDHRGKSTTRHLDDGRVDELEFVA